MKLKRLEVFTADEVEMIHNATVQLLATVGVRIESKGVQKMFTEYGGVVNPVTNFIQIPESLLSEQLKKVPAGFTLYGPTSTFHYDVDTQNSQYVTIGTPVRIYDPEKKFGTRKTVLQDNIDQLRILDQLEHIMGSHVDVWPNDVLYTALHAHAVYQWVKNSRKSYGLGVYGRVASQDVMNMTSKVVGSEDELINHPRLVGFFNTTSPLHLPQIMTNGFEIFAKYKQPTIIAPEAMAGTSAPVTLAGLVTQTNAEILAGTVLGQLVEPDTPVFYGTVSNITDMRSGNSAMGSIETGLITAAMAQMARYYHIPSRGPGCVTDSKCLDLQNGYERMQTLLLAAQCGINYITCAGTYEATLAEALELLVIDDELVGMMKRMMEGINVSEEMIGLEVIQKVATSEKKGVTFLGEKHTLKNMRQELYFPKITDRSRRNSWQKAGMKDIIQQASERVKDLLQQWQPPYVDPQLDHQLLQMIHEIERRDMEFYKKAEGISADSITIAGTEAEIK